MPRFLIERGIPALGSATPEELRAVAEKSNAVLSQLGGTVQWVQSYITDDTMFCIYVAEDADGVREHARRGGFPADKVLEISTIVDPVTAEG